MNPTEKKALKKISEKYPEYDWQIWGKRGHYKESNDYTKYIIDRTHGYQLISCR